MTNRKAKLRFQYVRIVINRSIELLVHYLIKVMASTIQEEILELIIIAVLKKEPVNCGRKYEIPVFF